MQVLPDFFAGGDYTPGPSIATLANAMDVGAPSNFERLLYDLYKRDGTEVARDDVLFTWDPYTNPIIADVEALDETGCLGIKERPAVQFEPQMLAVALHPAHAAAGTRAQRSGHPENHVRPGSVSRVFSDVHFCRVANEVAS